MEQISAEVRERIERRYRGKLWKLHVCAEPDGEKCQPGLSRVVYHDCEASRRHIREPNARRPLVVFIEVVPRLIETE